MTNDGQLVRVRQGLYRLPEAPPLVGDARESGNPNDAPSASPAEAFRLLARYAALPHLSAVASAGPGREDFAEQGVATLRPSWDIEERYRVPASRVAYITVAGYSMRGVLEDGDVAVVYCLEDDEPPRSGKVHIVLAPFGVLAKRLYLTDHAVELHDSDGLYHTVPFEEWDEEWRAPYRVVGLERVV